MDKTKCPACGLDNTEVTDTGTLTYNQGEQGAYNSESVRIVDCKDCLVVTRVRDFELK